MKIYKQVDNPRGPAADMSLDVLITLHIVIYTASPFTEDLSAPSDRRQRVNNITG